MDIQDDPYLVDKNEERIEHGNFEGELFNDAPDTDDKVFLF